MILSVLSEIIDVIGELFLTAGVLVTLLVFYLLYRSGLETRKTRQRARKELQQAWPTPALAPAPTPEDTEPAVERS